MNWKKLRAVPWIDTRAKFVDSLPNGGKLLDIGSSDGATLRHMFELRPDLKFFSTDLCGTPENYPPACSYHQGDIQKDPLPIENSSLDGVTCMHLVEHLTDHEFMFKELFRLLKPGSQAYIETPHPKSLIFSSPAGEMVGYHTSNFYDDLTHTKPVTIGALAQYGRQCGLKVVKSGISRNWLFAASYLFYFFAQPSSKKYVARNHFIGWSAYIILQRPPDRKP